MVNDPITILIPERGQPNLLIQTLDSLEIALRPLNISHETLVLVNGSSSKLYKQLQQKYPWILWNFVQRPLGFHGAVERLLAKAFYPWVYLLNSDMRLHPDALRVLLDWRNPDVFAIASQIYLVDPQRQREETGYTVPHIDEQNILYLHDKVPTGTTVRGHLYASGGASLFQTALLRRYIKNTHAYSPFYFEDADWSIQAWAEGFNVLFCPQSQAIHQHRATISHYYSDKTIQRIFLRNLDHFRWRYGDFFDAARGRPGPRWTMQRILRRLTPEHRRARNRLLKSTLHANFNFVSLKRFPHTPRFRPNKPRVLIVSPFAVLPPAHGGARRILELARASAKHIDWVLLHDEAESSCQGEFTDDLPFREIHPIGGRPKHSDDPLERITAHGHPRLISEMQRLIQSLQINLVCLEHIESVLLIDAIPKEIPILLTLHDVGRHLPESVVSLLQQRLSKLSGLILTTTQDLNYWKHSVEKVIENGVQAPSETHLSPECGGILLIAPLRYSANREGLFRFLAEAWPTLRQQLPKLELTILGGLNAYMYWSPADSYPGVTSIDGFVNPATYYSNCALVINPQISIEGSAIKIAEALAHGRIIVTTYSGARGYESLFCPALCKVKDLSNMTEVIVRYISHPTERWKTEMTAQPSIQDWSWEYRAAELVNFINQCLHPA